uniref:Uncharacterized protein n=1 Tax=Anguilla anguilla TaxID=7936 RepID=A0A0E9VEZ1_ANGAN
MNSVIDLRPDHHS